MPFKHHTNPLISPLIALSLGLTLFSPGAAAAAPDLVISGWLEAGDEVAEAGDRVSLEFVVRNSGDQDVDDPRVGFYLSTDPFLGGGDIFLEAETLGDLDAGESEDEREQVGLPNVADGNYYLLLAIDDLNWVSESDETNNVSAAAITIGDGGSPGVADLAIDSSRMSYTEFDEGATLVIDYVVENRGSAPVSEVPIALYLSSDSALSDDDTYLRWDETDGIAPGSSVVEDAFIDVPPSLEPGTYFVLVEADPDDEIEELSEGNNVGAIAFEVAGEVEAEVDLVAESLTIAPRQRVRRPGQPITASYGLSNLGPDVSGDFVYSFYVVYQRDGMQVREALKRLAVEGGLGAGEAIEGVETLSLPEEISGGSHRIELEVDSGEALRETDESNNIAEVGIRVRGS